MKTLISLISLLTICFTVPVMAQAAGKAGKDGEPGQKGQAGNAGETIYITIHNDLDLDALQVDYAHKDYLKRLGDLTRFSDSPEDFIQGQVEQLILDDSRFIPTLDSPKSDRDFLICYAIAQNYTEIIAVVNFKKTDLPDEVRCRTLFAQQKTAKQH